MPHKNPRQLAARAERAWTQKRNYYGLFTECWRYAAPGIDPYRATSGAPGEGYAASPQGGERYTHLYDSTLARAAMRHANRLVSEIFPAGRDWAELREGPMFGQGLEERATQVAIESVQTKVFKAIHASNFNLAVNMMAFDGVVSGTGCMKVGVSADSSTLLDFEAVNQAQVAFEAGPRGAVWGFYRKIEETREHVRVLWPDAREIPVTEQEGDTRVPRKYELLECTTYAPEEGIWHYDLLLRTSGASGAETRLLEREYVVCPWLVWRYLQLPGEVQGRSPVMAALPDARTANHATRTRLKSASIRVNGVFTAVNDGSFNPETVHFASGTIIPVQDNSTATPSIRPLDLPGDPQFGELILEDTRESINQTLLNIGLPEPSGAVRSATEIIERQRDALRNLGQPYLRMSEEIGRPILRVVAYLLSEAGLLEELAAVQPAMPNGAPAPLMLDGRDVSVSFTNPMVQAQQLSDAETIVRWAEAAPQTAGPEGFQAAVRTEEIPALLAEKMGAPPELIRTEQERAALADDLRNAAMPQPGGTQ